MVTSQVSGLPLAHGINLAQSGRFPPCAAKTNRLVVRLNLRSFDYLPDSVVEHCMTLLSCSALRTGEAMEAPDVDHLATKTGVGSTP